MYVVLRGRAAHHTPPPPPPGRVRIGDLITRVGATDVQFSAADVVQDLLDKVRGVGCALTHLVARGPSASLKYIFTSHSAF